MNVTNPLGAINPSVIPALAISIIVFVIYAFYLTPRQYMEVRRPRDWLTGLRYIILALLLLALVTSVPSIIYQVNRLFGTETDMQQNIVGITTNVSRLAGALLLVYIYTYKQKGDK